jgi:hypothetical protein
LRKALGVVVADSRALAYPSVNLEIFDVGQPSDVWQPSRLGLLTVRDLDHDYIARIRSIGNYSAKLSLISGNNLIVALMVAFLDQIMLRNTTDSIV